MPRKKAEETESKIGNYFIADKPLNFINSGCELLNCVLGGGYPLGRVTNIVGDKSTGKCAKDAYILNEQGMVHLDTKLKNYEDGSTENEQLLTVDKNSKVLSTHSYKEQVTKTYKITTRHGFELECTEDHPILISTENCEEKMVKTKDLTIGDVAIIAKGTNTFGSDTSCDEDLAFLLGCIIANGTNPKFGRVGISTYKKYLHSKLSLIIKRLGLTPYVKEFGVEIYNKEFALDIWKRFFNAQEELTARYKFVPKQILESPKHIQAAFLRGLIDCDSYLCKNHLEYYTASEVLSKQVHLMLLNLGIVANRSYDDGAYIGEKFYDNKYWTVSFGGKYLNIYAEVVGSDKYKFNLSSERCTSDFDNIPNLYRKLLFDWEELKRKLGWSRNGKLANGGRFPGLKLYSWDNVTYGLLEKFVSLYKQYESTHSLKFYEELIEKNYHYDYITSIEVIIHEEGVYVYDVYVPENHRFWCNGFISHNTQLAIEAFANFNRQFPDGAMYYHEAEAAFDTEYARALGLPIDKVLFVEGDTIEEFFESLSEVIDIHKESKQPGIYVLDSLDALSDKAEKERKIDEGTFAMNKQKKLSEIFRRLVSDLEKTQISLIVISQVRDNIGVMFGEKYKRSGGKALDFYASQVLWLSEIEKIQKTVKGIKRPIGIKVKAKCKKNKISMPFRECEFPIIFGYGIDDVSANIEFLKDVKDGMEGIDEANVNKAELNERVKKVWAEIEEWFITKERKYE